MEGFYVRWLEAVEVLNSPYSSQVVVPHVREVSSEVYDLRSEVLVSRSDFGVVPAVLLLLFAVLCLSLRIPCHLEISSFLRLIMHCGYGCVGTSIVPLGGTVLSLGVHFYLQKGVRWFRLNRDQHVFGYITSALTEVGHKDIELVARDIIY